MNLYRIAKTKYVNDLSGYGAFLYGGRWNEKSVHALYCSTSRPLAVLELLVHRTGGQLGIPDFSMIDLVVPDESILDKYDESLQLLQEENSVAQQKLARSCFADHNVVGVRVASAILHQEANVILNPNSHFHSQLVISEQYPIVLDSRLLA